MNFLDFKFAVEAQFSIMAKGQLFVVDVSKDELWETYLKSFPEGTNPIYRERTEHDCQCCRTFITGGGNVVQITENLEIKTIWDIEIGGHYQVVADAMAELVRSRTIAGVFTHFQKDIGTDHNHEMVEGNAKRWDHFHFRLPLRFVHDGIGNPREKSKEEKDLLSRSLNEISLESLDIVLEMIQQGSVYRLDEHKNAVEKFQKIKAKYERIPDDMISTWLWRNSNIIGPAGRIKNTVVGTLLIDISVGMTLDKAVYRFEHKMDPARFKHPRAIATKGMIKKAEERVKELGYIDSLARRHATIDDITVNNVLFANRDAKSAMNVFDDLAASLPVDIRKLKKVEEIHVDAFVKDILPGAETIEVYFENSHENNLMSLVAPWNPHGKNMLKWKNNFSWAYNGELADSMRELVRQAGGKVDGVLRYTIKWNDGDNNQNDFDAHCLEPAKGPGQNRNLIDFHSKGQRHPSSGMLDVDITVPGSKPAVENIIYTDLKRMPVGEYDFMVHNYSHNGGMTGFTAEIEFEGQIHTFVYNKNLIGRSRVKVATVSLDSKGKFKITKSLDSTVASKTIWDINSCQFHKVSLIMNSPNHWDGEEIGNKHLFFVLEGCKNDKPVRGFFNEFLKEDLTEYRKVFEMLGERMKSEPTEDQLSGLGFSSTNRASILCKITGTFIRTIKIIF